MSLNSPPKAFLTDVFGTVVDWRSTVTNHLIKSAEEVLGAPSSYTETGYSANLPYSQTTPQSPLPFHSYDTAVLTASPSASTVPANHPTQNSPTRSLPSTTRAAAATISWPAFAQQWRNTYYHFTRSYDPSAPGATFKSVDQHHLDSLLTLLSDHGIPDLWSPKEIHKISLIWHFLDPWPDSSRGLGQLNALSSNTVTATLSNGNQTLLADLAKHGDLPYTHIISAEDFKAYKPHPDVYLGAAKKLGLAPEECALVAAHLGDLYAARGCGYQTVYIERAQEEVWDEGKVQEARGWVDMWVGVEEGGFEEVARRFVAAREQEESGKL